MDISANVAHMHSNSTVATGPVIVLDREKLDELRRANGIESEAELARIIGVSPVTLWRVSRGDVSPSSGFIARVMTAFPHASMQSLFKVEARRAA